MVLRQCECGAIASTEEELELFEKDARSLHGRRNRCKVCAADKTKLLMPAKGVRKSSPTGVTCNQCRKVFISPLEIFKGFRRVAPSGDLIVGSLSKVCKACESQNIIDSGEEMVEIDGMLIPKDLNSKLKAIRITSKPLVAVSAHVGILNSLQF